MYRYDRKLKPHEIVVALLCLRSEEELTLQLNAYGKQYGFSLAVLKNCENLASLRNIRCRHLIIVGHWHEWTQISATVDLCIAHFDSLSLALDYRSTGELTSSAGEVARFRARYGETVNFLMPVRGPNGSWRVPQQKILDNAVCDTVRIKYVPFQESATAPPLSGEEIAYFRGASDLIRKFGLYFRSLTDGYIAVRSGNRKGFFITATKTNKVRLDLERVSFVHSYDRPSNSIRYSGQFLPSSDAVEAAITFEGQPNVGGLLHTHGSQLFTRNPRYADRILVPSLPYGTPALGDAISDAFALTACDWLIMEEHGELFAGVSGAGALRCLSDACTAELAVPQEA
jgi:hypothetical protein